MFIVAAQIIGIFAMTANILAFQFKTKRNLILSQLVGAVLFAVNMFMLGAMMGGILNIVAIIRSLVYIRKEHLKLPIKVVNAMFVLVSLTAYVLVFTVFGKEVTVPNLIIELIPVLGTITLTMGLSGKDAKTVRICSFINSPCWLIYNTINFTIGGILCEAFTLISSFLGFIRYDLKKKSTEPISSPEVTAEVSR